MKIFFVRVHVVVFGRRSWWWWLLHAKWAWNGRGRNQIADQLWMMITVCCLLAIVQMKTIANAAWTSDFADDADHWSSVGLVGQAWAYVHFVVHFQVDWFHLVRAYFVVPGSIIWSKKFYVLSLFLSLCVLFGFYLFFSVRVRFFNPK